MIKNLSLILLLLLVVVIATSTFTRAQEVVMQKYTVKNATQRLALANDGSPQVYYFVKGSTQSDQIILYLEGGWWCTSNESCTQRWGGGNILMSSKNRPATRQTEGYLSTDVLKNPFATFHKIYVAYTSSDGYMGNSSSAECGLPWQFRGRPSLFAIIEDLFTGIIDETTGQVVYQAGQGSEILISGGSAGGFGVLHNTKDVGDLITKNLCPTCKFAALSDSGFFVGTLSDPFENYTNCNSSEVTCAYPLEIRQAAPVWRTDRTINPVCAAAMGSSNQPIHHCLYGEIGVLFTAPYRIFLNRYLFDGAEMTADDIIENPYTPGAIAVLADIIMVTRTVLKKFPSFVPSCFGHEQYDGLGLQGLTANHVTLTAALSLWYNQNVQDSYFDKCDSMDCRHCPYDP
jgi:hypothetical protein